jgi:septin family protein
MGQDVSKSCRNDTVSTRRAIDAQQDVPRARRDLKFRVLIIGRALSGKTSILQRICDTTESPEVYRLDRQGYDRERVRSRS